MSFTCEMLGVKLCTVGGYGKYIAVISVSPSFYFFIAFTA
jgi:hypothetical protein